MSESMDELMKKLPEHKAGKAYFYQRENIIDTDELMKGLAGRADSIKEQHEAERIRQREALEDRTRLHPDQYEKLQQQREALKKNQPEEVPRMTEDEKREAWKRTLRKAEADSVRQTGTPVYNHNGMLIGYRK